MSLEDDQKRAIIEALLLGADRDLAAESAGVDVRQLYRWINAHLEPTSVDPAAEQKFGIQLREAEAKGKEHLERTKRMRFIVERHDAAMSILEERSKRFREARDQLARGVQPSLFS